MRLNELFSEADPMDLGKMNDKMRDVLSKVHSGDEKEKQDKIDAENKAKDDAKKAATMYAIKHPEEMEEYVKLLKSHDWTYDYSDDHSVWRRGADAHKKLRQMSDKLDPEHEVWNKYDPFAKKDESQYTKTRDKEDLQAKQKALQDLQADPNTSKDPELKKEIIKRKAALDKDANEMADIMRLAGMEESATAGATSAGNIASVEAPHLSPGKARGKKSYTGNPWGGKSGTKAPPQPKVKQPKAANGTAKNALDMKNSIFGENPVRR